MRKRQQGRRGRGRLRIETAIWETRRRQTFSPLPLPLPTNSNNKGTNERRGDGKKGGDDGENKPPHPIQRVLLLLCYNIQTGLHLFLSLRHKSPSPLAQEVEREKGKKKGVLYRTLAIRKSCVGDALFLRELGNCIPPKILLGVKGLLALCGRPLGRRRPVPAPRGHDAGQRRRGREVQLAPRPGGGARRHGAGERGDQPQPHLPAAGAALGRRQQLQQQQQLQAVLRLHRRRRRRRRQRRLCSSVRSGGGRRRCSAGSSRGTRRDGLERLQDAEGQGDAQEEHREPEPLSQDGQDKNQEIQVRERM